MKMEVMNREEVGNELLKISGKGVAFSGRSFLLFKKMFIVMCCVSVLLIVFYAWAAEGRNKAQRELAESNRLVEQYRERDVEASRLNRELAERNQRLEAGVASIREIASSAGGNIRQAIGIISGVQSVLKTLETDGGYWDTGGAGGGARGGVGD
jgi:hypothetical protein